MRMRMRSPGKLLLAAITGWMAHQRLAAARLSAADACAARCLLVPGAESIKDVKGMLIRILVGVTAPLHPPCPPARGLRR
jgi:hypothetical protein